MSQKILVVDDELDVVELLAFNLRREGYEVLTAGNGADALELARREHPDLIVLDVMLPELDGLAVCEILRRQPATATIPILLLTACASEPARVIGFETGADDYVTKPFSPRELALRIRRLLERQAGLQPA
jgi:DNA-binding response OmpR family regulator